MIACPEAGPGDGLVAHAEGELQVFGEVPLLGGTIPRSDWRSTNAPAGVWLIETVVFSLLGKRRLVIWSYQSTKDSIFFC